MQDEYEIVDSPLSQKVSRDGMTVEVLIYRGKDDSGWMWKWSIRRAALPSGKTGSRPRKKRSLRR
jgi:hypothetical protein